MPPGDVVFPSSTTPDFREPASSEMSSGAEGVRSRFEVERGGEHQCGIDQIAPEQRFQESGPGLGEDVGDVELPAKTTEQIGEQLLGKALRPSRIDGGAFEWQESDAKRLQMRSFGGPIGQGLDVTGHDHGRLILRDDAGRGGKIEGWIDHDA